MDLTRTIKDQIGQLQSSTIQFLALVLVLVVTMLIAGVLSPGFLTFEHIMTILYINTMLGILAIAQTVVILSGGIDLSTGSTFWITIMVGALFMYEGALLFPAIICIGLGAVIGFINGFCISKLRIPFVVMTLAMMIIITGTLYVTTGGGGHGRAAPELISFSTGKVYKVPNIVIVWIILTIFFYIFLKKTTIGWKIRALGSNPQACYTSGICIWKIVILVYVISGTLAAISGLFYLGWARTPYPTFQSGAGVGAVIMLKSIAAVIIGGTLFSGGRGGVERTIMGVLILGVILSILSMVGLGWEWQMMLNGLLVLGIVGAHSRVK